MSWYALGDPWLKFNSDGSALGPGNVACGGVLHDSFGCFIRTFAANVGHCPVVGAEIWGALYALEIAWSMGITHLILELDSSSVVSLIQHFINNSHPFLYFDFEDY